MEVQFWKLHIVYESGKFKMAAAKPAICIYLNRIHTTSVSQLLLHIETKYQRLAPIFGVQEVNGTIVNTMQFNWKSAFQNGGRQTRSTYISASILDINAVPMAKLIAPLSCWIPKMWGVAVGTMLLFNLEAVI